MSFTSVKITEPPRRRREGVALSHDIVLALELSRTGSATSLQRNTDYGYERQRRRNGETCEFVHDSFLLRSLVSLLVSNARRTAHALQTSSLDF
jgi:hypothetical protein